MKRTYFQIISVTCLVCTFVLGFAARDNVSFVSDASAQNEKSPGTGRCSNRTLKGAYGIKFEGLSLAGGPIASVARITFDGEGQFTTNEVGRLNGNGYRRTFTGPYTVHADCTGFLDFSSDLSGAPHEVHGEIIIVDGGKEFFVLDDEDGLVASGVGKRL